VDTKRKQILQWRSGPGGRAKLDWLVVEEPLEIRVDSRPVSVTMRTPGYDEELAAGFLLSEGLIHKAEDLGKIERHRRNRVGNVVDVFLAEGVALSYERLTRHVFVSSSCGLCGKATIESVRQEFPPLRDRSKMTALAIGRMPRALLRGQTAFSRTGGLHAAALFDRLGRLLVLREDVGRHNAVDKVLGWQLLKGALPGNAHALLVSGRASFEIVQKALAARIPLVAAVSAPTSLAVELAHRSGQTLIGFLRPGRMNVYAGRGRVEF